MTVFFILLVVLAVFPCALYEYSMESRLDFPRFRPERLSGFNRVFGSEYHELIAYNFFTLQPHLTAFFPTNRVYHHEFSSFCGSYSKAPYIHLTIFQFLDRINATPFGAGKSIAIIDKGVIATGNQWILIRCATHRG